METWSLNDLEVRPGSPEIVASTDDAHAGSLGLGGAPGNGRKHVSAAPGMGIGTHVTACAERPCLANVRETRHDCRAVGTAT